MQSQRRQAPAMGGSDTGRGLWPRGAPAARRAQRRGDGPGQTARGARRRKSFLLSSQQTLRPAPFQHLPCGQHPVNTGYGTSGDHAPGQWRRLRRKGPMTGGRAHFRRSCRPIIRCRRDFGDARSGHLPRVIQRQPAGHAPPVIARDRRLRKARCRHPGHDILRHAALGTAGIGSIVRRASLWPQARGSGLFTRLRATKAAAMRHRHLPFCGWPCSRISGARCPASCTDRAMPVPAMRRRARPAIVSVITPDPRVRAGGNSRYTAGASAGRPASGQDATAGGPWRAGCGPPGGRDPDTCHGCPRHR